MGKMTDLTVRKPEELNTNRKGPLGDILAIVDRDRAGNEVIVQITLVPEGPDKCPAPHYLLCTDETYHREFKTIFDNLRRSSRRDLRLVKLRVVEE